MSASVSWLAGKRALVAGTAAILHEIASALHEAGARVSRPSDGAAGDFEGDLSRAERELGGAIDLLVHGGVPLAERVAQDISLEVWRAGVSQDMDARFLQTTAFARRCIDGKSPGAVLYLLPSQLVAAERIEQSTCVGAVENLIKTLAVEWARDGIRVNGIASRACEQPGKVSLAMRESLGRLAAYLLSDYAAYVTGTVTGIREFA